MIILLFFVFILFIRVEIRPGNANFISIASSYFILQVLYKSSALKIFTTKRYSIASTSSTTRPTTHQEQAMALCKFSALKEDQDLTEVDIDEMKFVEFKEWKAPLALGLANLKDGIAVAMISVRWHAAILTHIPQAGTDWLVKRMLGFVKGRYRRTFDHPSTYALVIHQYGRTPQVERILDLLREYTCNAHDVTFDPESQTPAKGTVVIENGEENVFVWVEDRLV